MFNFYYDKNNSWGILSETQCNLLTHILECIVDSKKSKYVSLKQCAKIVYVLNNSLSAWSENNYLEFLKKSPNDLIESYTTLMKSVKGSHNSITRENVQILKNDFNYIFSVFSQILAGMVMDNKKKLFFDKKI